MMHITTDRGLDLGCKVSTIKPLLMSLDSGSPPSPGVSVTAPHSWLGSVSTPSNCRLFVIPVYRNSWHSARSVYFIQSKRPGAHKVPQDRGDLPTHHPPSGLTRLWPPQSPHLPHALQTCPMRPCLSASPLTAPSACEVLVLCILTSPEVSARQLPWTPVSKFYHLGSVFGTLKRYCFSSFKNYLNF